jgi:DsbC/DsbD-like thiol-disulfide interchange protein
MNNAKLMARLGILAALAALLVFSAAPSDAGGKKSDSKVKISADAAKPDAAGKQLVTVHIAIEDGWYIYANPVENKDFEENRTIISAVAGKKEIDAKVVYPAGKKKSLGDINYAVYTDKVTIQVELVRPAGAPVTLHVRISACNVKGICYLPATVKVELP